MRAPSGCESLRMTGRRLDETAGDFPDGKSGLTSKGFATDVAAGGRQAVQTGTW